MKAARFLILGAAFVIGATTSIAAVAQDKEKVIADRQDLMKKQVRDWIAIRNYLAGNADQPVAVAAAEALTKSLPTVPNYFPPGTAGPTPDGKWGTKPEVWTEHDKFLAAVREVSDQVATLPAVAADLDVVARGEYLANAADCAGCHTDAEHGGKPYAGGLPLATPFGTFFAPNITSDPETGIGRWTDAQFLHALRNGIRADGANLFPVFPYTSYTGITDEDALAIKAYLFAQPTVQQPNR